MITIDPEVDTPDVLTGYVRSFLPGAVALRTTDDEILRPAPTAFGADYGKIEQGGGRAAGVPHRFALRPSTIGASSS